MKIEIKKSYFRKLSMSGEYSSGGGFLVFGDSLKELFTNSTKAATLISFTNEMLNNKTDK